MTDLEMTRLCSEAMGLEIIKGTNHYLMVRAVVDGAHGLSFHFDPLHDDAQAMALVKRFSLQIHHHGCADSRARLVTVTGKWLPYTTDFKSCAVGENQAIVGCVAKMQASKP